MAREPRLLLFSTAILHLLLLRSTAPGVLVLFSFVLFLLLAVLLKSNIVRFMWFFGVFVCLFLLFRAIPVAYGRSQARGSNRS